MACLRRSTCAAEPDAAVRQSIQPLLCCGKKLSRSQWDTAVTMPGWLRWFGNVLALSQLPAIVRGVFLERT
ncbi:MAG: hypothetical protein EAZ99_09325 [Alphaproteobacteria bacterium]|nr:MAG: hypothetical protein EAZ99_09325 [Alphaproteobacteria bacterium]